MRRFRITAGAASLACCMACFGQSEGFCGQSLNTPVSPGSSLVVNTLPGELAIVGTDRDQIHIFCSAKDEAEAKKIHLKISQTSSQAKLSIVGSHVAHGQLRVRIEVPRRINLSVHMPAGEVRVSEIVGDKKITVHAGQITVSSANDWNYRTVNASVGIGEVNARVYATDKGGLLRTFRKRDPSGDYQLDAHVTTGQIDLVRNEVPQKD